MAAPFLNREDIESLRAYVTGPDAGGLNQADSTVMLHVTHSNLQARFMEIRLDLHMTIEAVKVKLSFHCGTGPASMILQLLNEDGQMLFTLDDDNKKLGYYSPRNGFGIHIVDCDPNSASAAGALEDVSQIEKYKISDESYNAREHTYRKWKDDRLKADPTWTLEKEMCIRRGQEYTPAAPKISDPDHMKEEALKMQMGQRCSVDPGDRRGEIKFIGQVDGLPAGWWIGIQYDEPVGKNDGSVKGRKFFECVPGFGGFVRPDKVTMGDFPPLDEFGEDDLQPGDEL